ncbi:hypothetical protein EYF80_048443 [Liparis tanakae]|uniref:Uncharacterized protein n=1 Tax=Liparis tanakae TaxID=230148 RepID=A0A4Z2FK96_9TELE|nr:hypothetical protein EYF80_048443 [Liparis tanakae]
MRVNNAPRVSPLVCGGVKGHFVVVVSVVTTTRASRTATRLSDLKHEGSALLPGGQRSPDASRVTGSRPSDARSRTRGGAL